MTPLNACKYKRSARKLNPVFSAFIFIEDVRISGTYYVSTKIVCAAKMKGFRLLFAKNNEIETKDFTGVWVTGWNFQSFELNAARCRPLIIATVRFRRQPGPKRMRISLGIRTWNTRSPTLDIPNPWSHVNTTTSRLFQG
jgi:hypothetical protein